MHTRYGFLLLFLLPGLRWRRGDEVTESGYDDRDDDRYGYLSLRSLQRPQHPLLNPSQRRLPRRQRRHHI